MQSVRLICLRSPLIIAALLYHIVLRFCSGDSGLLVLLGSRADAREVGDVV